MIVGICEVNRRQYCAGVWPSIEAVQKELAGAYQITELAGEAVAAHRRYSPLAAGAVAVYDAQDLGTDSDVGHLGSDADGFTLYEYADTFPGFCPFDED